MPGCRVGLRRPVPTYIRENGSALEVVLHDYALYKSTFTLLYSFSLHNSLPPCLGLCRLAQSAAVRVWCSRWAASCFMHYVHWCVITVLYVCLLTFYLLGIYFNLYVTIAMFFINKCIPSRFECQDSGAVKIMLYSPKVSYFFCRTFGDHLLIRFWVSCSQMCLLSYVSNNIIKRLTLR